MTRVYLRSSVAAGQPRAQGDGLEKRLFKAAEEGDARSQYNLGILYGSGLDDNGYAVEVDRPRAVRAKPCTTPSRIDRLNQSTPAEAVSLIGRTIPFRYRSSR